MAALQQPGQCSEELGISLDNDRIARLTMPRVSVIMPAYNCARFIDAAIASVLAQTEASLELIVIDDGSKDDTLARATSWSNRDSRVRVLTQPNSGRPGATRNVGLRVATGEYVCFLDSDDLCERDRITQAVSVLEIRPELGALFHDMSYMDVDGNALPGSYLEHGSFKQRAAKHLVDQGDGLYLCRGRFHAFMAINYTAMHTDTVILRRDAIEKNQLRFPDDVSIGEDTELWFNLARTIEIAYLDRKLSRYREHSAGITRNRDRWWSDLYVVHARNYRLNGARLTRGERAAYRRRISLHCFSEGYFHWSGGRKGVAREAYLRAFNWRPNLKSILAYGKTLVPDAILHLATERRSSAKH